MMTQKGTRFAKTTIVGALNDLNSVCKSNLPQITVQFVTKPSKKEGCKERNDECDVWDIIAWAEDIQ